MTQITFENQQAAESTVWIRDMVYLAFDEGEARERALLDLIGQFSRLQPDDPEWIRYKLNLVEYKAIEKIAARLTEVSAGQERLRTTITSITKQAETDLRKAIQSATDESQQAIEDVRAKLEATLSGEAVIKMYGEETQRQFGVIIQTLMQKQLEAATALVTKRMQLWVEESVDGAVKQVGLALTAATKDFRVRLYGAWSGLLWAMVAGGVIAALGVFGAGWWLGRQ